LANVLVASNNNRTITQEGGNSQGANYTVLSNLGLNYVNLLPHCNYAIARASLQNGNHQEPVINILICCQSYQKLSSLIKGTANLSLSHVFKLYPYLYSGRRKLKLAWAFAPTAILMRRSQAFYCARGRYLEL
jgi:hypothetical protein